MNSRKQPHSRVKPALASESEPRNADEIAVQDFSSICCDSAAFWVAQIANGRSLLLPANKLRTLFKSATGYCVLAGGPMFPAFSRLLWSNPAARVAVLQLQALCLRVLANADSLSATDCEPYCSLSWLIVLILQKVRSNKNGPLLLDVVDLALRMDVLPAAAAALAALRADGRLPADLKFLWSLFDLIDLVLCATRPVSAPRGSVAASSAPPEPPGPDVASVLDQLARSGLMEQAVCALVHIGMQCSSGAEAGGGHRQIPPRVLACAPSSGPSSASFLGRQYNCVMQTVDHIFMTLAAIAAKGFSMCPASRYDVAVSSTTAIIAGPCFQYGAAAHVVAQLAAADGGTMYGLSAAQALPPTYEPPEDQSETAAARTAAGGHGGRQSMLQRRRQPQLPLRHGTLCGALIIWTWCFEQSPPVPVRPLSRGFIRQLALRAARVATASCHFHWACGQQRRDPAAPQKRQERQHHGGSDGQGSAPLQVPFGKGVCAMVVADALRCAAATFKRRRPSQEAGAGAGQDTAAAAAALAGLRAREWWGVAVPGLHAVLSCLEANATEPMPEIHPLMDPNAVSDLDLDPALGWLCDLESKGARGRDAVTAAAAAVAPPVLGAVLTAGYIPLLERTLRVQQRSSDTPETAYGLWGESRALRWPSLGLLLAYGEPYQVGSLLATLGKLAAKCVEPLVAWLSYTAGGGGAASGSGSDGDPSTRTRYGVLEMITFGLPLEERPGLRSWVACAERVAMCLRAGDAGGTEQVPEAEGGPAPEPVEAEAAQHHLPQQQPQQQVPLRQFLRCTLLAARVLLPHLATVAKASWLMGTRDGDLQPRCPVQVRRGTGTTLLRWLPALLAVHATARGRLAVPPRVLQQQQLAGCGTALGAIAEELRTLVLEQLSALDVVDEMLRFYVEGQPMDDSAEEHCVLAACVKTLAVLVVEFLDQVAAAMRQGRLLPAACLGVMLCSPWSPEGATAAEPLGGPFAPWLAARLSELEGGLAEGGPAAHHAAEPELGISAPGVSGAGAGEAAALPAPTQVTRWALEGAAHELGAQLLAEMCELQRESWEGDAGGGGEGGGGAGAGGVQLPRRCSNPRCSSLEGDSEGGRRLLRCNGCGGPQYCGKGCQVAHWRAGHKGECRHGKPAAAGGGGAAGAAAATPLS